MAFKVFTDLMVKEGLVNLDFADVETVMSSMGKAMMGTGEAEGEGRAQKATEMALNNPLIDDYSLKGAKGLLINITGGEDLTLFEVDEIVNRIRSEVDHVAEIIIGSITDPTLEGKVRVSIVATALDGQSQSLNLLLIWFIEFRIEIQVILIFQLLRQINRFIFKIMHQNI